MQSRDQRGPTEKIACVALYLGLVLFGTAAPALGAEAAGDVTFAKDVAVILQRSCQNCHRPHGLAPMSLLTYEDARPWARAMKERTALREMPPWFIDKNIGIQHFKDDYSVTDEEIATIAAWADAGAPRGNPADLPPPIEWTDANVWRIGTPDLIVSSPVITVPAVGSDVYDDYGPVPIGLTEDRYIKAVEVKEVRLFGDDETGREARRQAEGSFAIFTIHHLGLHIGETYTTGVLGQDHLPLEERSGFRLTYNVGGIPAVYPDDTGVLLEAGSELRFAVHLFAAGQEIPVRADVGFVLHPRDFQPKYKQAGFIVMGSVGEDLDIPGNEDNVRHDGFYIMPQHGILTNYEPHMHAAGKRMCMEAIYADQTRETLNCSDYNHNWALAYVYEEDYAPILPKGTVLHISGWFDNTAKNRNVADPRNWQGWGNRSIDNMFLMDGRVTFLNDEQFAEVKAEREAARLSQATNQQN